MSPVHNDRVVVLKFPDDLFDPDDRGDLQGATRIAVWRSDRRSRSESESLILIKRCRIGRRKVMRRNDHFPLNSSRRFFPPRKGSQKPFPRHGCRRYAPGGIIIDLGKSLEIPLKDRGKSIFGARLLIFDHFDHVLDRVRSSEDQKVRRKNIRAFASDLVGKFSADPEDLVPRPGQGIFKRAISLEICSGPTPLLGRLKDSPLCRTNTSRSQIPRVKHRSP